MDPDKRVFVSIYCKIYANSFSEKMINVYATGTEIYDFLMKSAGVCFDPDGFPLPGDCNLWYLGCCEKFGHMVLGDDVWNWSHGQSSFDTVEAFVLKLHEKGLSTDRAAPDVNGQDRGGTPVRLHVSDLEIPGCQGPWIALGQGTRSRQLQGIYQEHGCRREGVARAGRDMKFTYRKY